MNVIEGNENGQASLAARSPTAVVLSRSVERPPAP